MSYLTKLDTLGRSNENKRGRKDTAREFCRQAYLNHKTAVWCRDNHLSYNSKHILTEDELELAIAGK